jgi:outer membrane lipoprotein SlyB
VSRKKKKTRPKPRGPAAPARFPIGTPIRVKPGTHDPDFPDIVLSGWTGTILDVEQGPQGPDYLIAWDERTLAALPPVYHTRCERDSLLPNCIWLDEDDLEANTGKPVTLEPPTQIVTRPPRPNAPEDRIRAILGLTHEEPLPKVNEANLRKYHAYLADQLRFPFRASRAEAVGPVQYRRHRITVTALLDPDEGDTDTGLMCEALEGGEEIGLPLAAVEDVAAGPNRQLVEDYHYWFWNEPSEGSVSRWIESLLPPDADSLEGQPDETPMSLRALATTMLTLGLAGGCYGAVLGAALASLDGAALAAKVGAVLLGLVGALFGVALQLPQGKWVGGFVGAVLGSLLGGMVGVMVVAFAGTLLGALAGGLVGRFLGSTARKSLTTFLGALAGSLLGVGIQAWRETSEAAFFGTWVGGLTGAVAGPVLLFTINMIVFLLDLRRQQE